MPTTVFTPIEYSFVGVSEEQALEQFGEPRVRVYHSRFTPYEDLLFQKYSAHSFEPEKRKFYMKVVCEAKPDGEYVRGIHYYGANSGEIIQGLSVALNTGALTFQHLQNTVGIHPIDGEEFVNLSVLKPNDPDKLGC